MSRNGFRLSSLECRGGFTFVEVMVATAVLVAFMGAVAGIVNMVADNFGRTQAEVVAVSVGQQQLELAHNLAYEDVGTVGGIPPGLLDQEYQVVVDNLEYTVRTTVVYIDDPFDDLAPVDIIPVDYKRIRIEVSWSGAFASRDPVVLWSDIAPKGLETIEGAGTIVINVFDAQVQPVGGADVHIYTDAVDPVVDFHIQTDDDGKVVLPGALVCTDCYQISVTKNGYTLDRTYGTDEVTNPDKPHLQVQEGKVTPVSLAIDRPSTVTFKAVRTAAYGYSPFAGVEMHVRGLNKKIGTDEFGENVYLYDERVVTAGTWGQVVVSNLVWDSYSVTLPPGSSIDVAGTSPFSPFALEPDSTMTFTMVVLVQTDNSLLVRVKDEHGSPIASATAELTNLTTQEVATQATALRGVPDWGQTIFTDLSPVSHLLRVLSEGYEEATSSVLIAGDMEEVLQLLPAD